MMARRRAGGLMSSAEAMALVACATLLLSAFAIVRA
jgi:hypothetical protein